MPNKGKKPAGGARGSKEHGGKKTTGTTKPADKTTTATAGKKPESTSASTSSSASRSSATATPGTSKVLSSQSQEKTMKASDTKAQTTPKTDPPKAAQATEPKSTTTSTASSASAAAKPSAGKAPAKQDAKAKETPKTTTTSSSSSTAKPSKEKGPAKQDAKADSKVSSAAGKGAAAVVGGASVGAAAVGVAASSKPKDEVSSAAGKGADAVVGGASVGAAAVGVPTSVSASSKPKDEVKEEKKLSADKLAADTTPSSSDKDDALDALIDTLGGPEIVPESPKYTGPEITDTPATSEHIEGLGERDDTIPPEYRNLLDGKGEKPVEPQPKKQSMSDDDLIAAMSSEFVSAPPEEKRPKLEEKKTAQSASTAPVASSQASSTVLTDDALDELLGTLEPPPADDPGSPEFTGPEITETITPSYLEELGKRESTIPPKYRNLLDGKDEHGKPLPPSADVPEPTMSDSELVDIFSKDFEDVVCPAPASAPAPVSATAPAPAPAPAAGKPQDTKKDKPAKSDVVVPSSAPSVQAGAEPSAGMDDALDELMGTLEGPEFSAPESPVYTGPEITETATSAYIEELGKREGSIPPKYRNLLDGKEGGKPALPSAEEKAMTDDELLDAIDKDFTCPQVPAAQQTPAAKTKEADAKKTESEAVVKSTSSSSNVQAGPAPSKAPTCKADPLDALAGTLGARQEDPKDKKKPVTDKVKEKTGKEKREKLGEDEETIPPEYRLKEVKDKDGKPLLPQPEEKPQPMSEDDLLDALSSGFVTSPVQRAPSQPLEKASVKSGSEAIVCSKAASVQSGAPADPDSIAHISDDALDLLSGSLGTRQEDPDEKKPVVDVVKERATEERIKRLGDDDDTIPPEYRNLLDGKEGGKPAKPEVVKPTTPISDDAAIDALSSGFASCDTKAKSSSKDKTEKSTPSAPVSQTAGKTPEASKDKVAQAAEKIQDASKSTSQSTPTKPSTPKTCKS